MSAERHDPWAARFSYSYRSLLFIDTPCFKCDEKYTEWYKNDACVGEHVESVLLPIQVRGTAGLFAGARIYLSSRQASAFMISVSLFSSHLLRRMHKPPN